MELKCDLAAQVARVAAFIGVEADEVLLAVATRQATFEFMRNHVDQFDDYPTTLAFNRVLGIPLADRTTKVRAASVGDSASLTPGARAAVARRAARDLVRAGAMSSSP